MTDKFRNLTIRQAIAVQIFYSSPDDENLVGKMEFDSAGTPLEGYGISNNPDSSQGPPTFDEAKFTVNQPDAAIEIAMTYW